MNNMELIRLIKKEKTNEIKDVILAKPYLINKTDSNKNTPLHFATVGENLEIVELLINAMVLIDEPNCNYHTPLMIAVIKGQTDIVKKLLENGADPNIRDNYGYTSVHQAASNNNLEIMQDLVAHCGNINVKTYSGYTVLHCVSYKALIDNNFRLTEWLIDQGADYIAKAENGQTVFQAFSADGSDGSYFIDILYKIIGQEEISFSML